MKKTFLNVDLQTFVTLNYAQLYQEALQQVYTVGLKFGALYNSPNNASVKWVGGKTIQVPTISVGGFVDVNRDSLGTTTRRVDNSFKTYTLEHDREFRTLVDPVDVDETNMAVTIANITRVFNTEQKVPEMDKYMASKVLAGYTAAGKTADTTVLTTANILTKFDALMEAMDEAEVPTEGRILYVTPAINTMLKNAEKLERQIDVGIGSAKEVNRSVRSLDEVQIEIVPSSRMKSLYDFSNGAIPASAAKQINLILIHPTALYSPQKYDFVSLDAPSAATGGKYVYYERMYWDVFVIHQKAEGIKINVEA